MATSATYGVAAYGSSQYGVVFVTGGAGSYTFTGGSATFRYDHNLTAQTGSFALTGQDAQPAVSHLLNGDATSYALTGSSTTLIHNDVIYAGYWQFNITGNDAGLTADRVLTSESGAYSITGGDATLAKDYIFGCDAGSFAWIGKDASLVYTPVVTEIITTGGIPKKVKTKVKKNQRDEVEAVVREAFDKMDGTYVPPKVVAEIQKEVKKEIKQIDLGQYDVAMAQINALLLTAKLKIHEYESELDDENALLLII